jgi:hypothetical protein
MDSGRMPLFSSEDRQQMDDNMEQLMAHGDWHMDPGSTYHRKIHMNPSPKCAIPTEDVHAFFSRVWNLDSTLENTFFPAD